MHTKKNHLKPGDLVEILSPAEIFKTIDSNGTINGLPFMPEMLELCGKKFRVLNRINKTCVEVGYPVSDREFINNDVVTLVNARCGGQSHSGCQRGCLIFWKETWLKKVASESNNEDKTFGSDIEKFGRQLKIMDDEKSYFCQSTQLYKATNELSRVKQLIKIFKNKKDKYNFIRAFVSVVISAFRKIKIKIIDNFPKGKLTKTPIETLNLQPGDMVEVKPYKLIAETLNKNGKNRGLIFSQNMKTYCGRRFKVKNRIEKMILEKNGKMIEMQSTVILEDVNCTACTLFGACERKGYHFWREIWLEKIEPQTDLQILNKLHDLQETKIRISSFGEKYQ